MTDGDSINRRRFERFRLQPMYSGVVARRDADHRALEGHAYDISEAGVRIELDDPLAPGEHVSIDLDLTGGAPVAATASVVWVNDAVDDPGARRMALEFDRFATAADRERLVRFLGGGAERVAA